MMIGHKVCVWQVKTYIKIREKSEKGKGNANGILVSSAWQQQTLKCYIVATKHQKWTMLSAPKTLAHQAHVFDEHHIQKVDEKCSLSKTKKRNKNKQIYLSAR